MGKGQLLQRFRDVQTQQQAGGKNEYLINYCFLNVKERDESDGG